MAEKVTVMKLKVDLECEKCYKKVKKLLAKYPQIRDQKFDEKENYVWITVVCCSPEKMRDKLCRKGGGSIKSIEILEPPKPKPPEKKKDEPKSEKPKEPEKKKEEPKPEKKKEEPKPEKAKEPEKKKEEPKPEKKKEEPKPEKTKEPKGDPPPVQLPVPPVPVYPPVPPPMAVPVGICCGPCYEGRPGGPYVDGYVGPPVYYDGYYGRPVYDSYGGGKPYYYVSRCDQYFSDENASGCTIM